MDKEKSPETSGRPTPSPTPIPTTQDLPSGQLSAEQIETLLKVSMTQFRIITICAYILLEDGSGVIHKVKF